MATSSQVVTVVDFRALPRYGGAVYHELRRGEVVAVTRPKLKHTLIQHRLRRLLETLAEEGSFVEIELAFRALPEYELRAAYVAYVWAERWKSADPEDNLRGAPDLIIEVFSPSSTASEIYDKEQLCLENGAREFWAVVPERKQVRVSTPDGHAVTWQAGQAIPLAVFGDASIGVDDIFAGV